MKTLSQLFPTLLKHANTQEMPEMKEATEFNMMEIIVAAINGDTMLRIDYTDRKGHEMIRVVSPSHIYMFADGAAYLACWDENKHARRTFALSRITDVEPVHMYSRFHMPNMLFPATWNLRRCTPEGGAVNHDKYTSKGWSYTRVPVIMQAVGA